MQENPVLFQWHSVIISRHIEGGALPSSRGVNYFLTMNRPEINAGALLLTIMN